MEVRRSPLRVGVVIATLGRPGECHDLLEQLRRQTITPDVIAISTEGPADLPEDLGDNVVCIFGPRGLCVQRNRGVRAIAEVCDVIVFYDDDYLPTRTSIEGVANLFASYPELVGATGVVLADGVTRGGIDRERAAAIVKAAEGGPVADIRILRNLRYTYGCNMAFRVAAMNKVSFDERLALYGWQEDVDFAGQILRYGRVVQSNAFQGVHRGVTGARTPGTRLGFSQIVNPIFLARKGTMRWSHAVGLLAGNVLANHLRLFRPEPHVDRAGRAKGNWIGLAHILSGQLDPSKIVELGC